MATTGTGISGACESFLSDWDRHEWMADNGEWVSSQWDDKRAEYDVCIEALRAAVGNLGVSERADADSLDDVLAAVDDLKEAVESLEGQVRADDSDYIIEGVIDPDGVRSGAIDLNVGCNSQGWNCAEGWRAYRSGDALVINWCRDACGDRHDRDLWVTVDPDFFADDESGDD